MLEYTEYTKMLVGLIAVVNPVGAIPIFISLTPNAAISERNSISRVAVFSVFIILLVSLFLGEALLKFLGISINSFRVAGGILIFLMALSMLHAKTSAATHTKEEAKESADKNSIAIVPLAMPLLAGPGAISTIILYAHMGTGVEHYPLIGLDILVLSTILFVVFKLVPSISKHISQTGINVFTRIMGLILAAIAIEFIANGAKGLFPVLMQ